MKHDENKWTSLYMKQTLKYLGKEIKTHELHSDSEYGNTENNMLPFNAIYECNVQR